MKNFNVVRLDSKGRIIIPYHIRELLDIEEGAEFVIISHENGEIKMVPLLKGNTAEINVHVEDTPGNLAKITELLARHNISIIMSQLKIIERGHLAEWHSLVDISRCPEIKKLKQDLSASRIIKKFDVIEK